MGNKIIYNGSVIAEPAGGQTVTLPCAGKRMLGDVVVQTNAVARSAIIAKGNSITIVDAPVTIQGNTMTIGG